MLAAALLVLLLAARTIAAFVIDFQWWKEMGQVTTWLDMLAYSIVPVAAGAVVLFGVLWIALARGMKFGGERLSQHRTFARVATLVVLALSVLLSMALIDSWTIMRYVGSQGVAAGSWRDPVFGKPLGFYFFGLPFYSLLLRFVLGASIATAVAYWIAGRIWQLGGQLRAAQVNGQIDLANLRLEGGLESRFLRSVGAIFLLALAVQFYLNRFDTLVEDHGFLVGADWVAVHLTIPLLYASAGVSVVCAIAILLGRYRWLLLLPACLLVQFVVPMLVSSVYVRPNEISLERPYIKEHIEATRAAFGLSEGSREVDFPARLEAPIDPARHNALLSNVRLWDWRAFHDTVSQIQSLRTYYVFPDTDVDRYKIDGNLRQVMLSPREIDVRQLGNQGSTRWINSHFIYTHGYGLVMASANRITPEGMPVFYIQDVPPQVNTPSLKVTRPEIYFGEATTQPVFVHTGQPEFNYPSGSDNVHTTYAGKGGFPIGPFPLRLAAALSQGDPNVLLTGYLKSQSRLMIRRRVAERVNALASFIRWDPDPYLVLTDSGRLMWFLDGFTVSDAHPYSRATNLGSYAGANYIRNSVKATVDAYDGETHFYVFDETDPIIQAYRRLFPRLFLPASELPPDLRAHVRYPEDLFRVQAEAYRIYHMRDPEAFYNKEDVWDIAKTAAATEGRTGTATPTYVVATLPGEDQAEFLLMLPFAPRNKNNLIGVMMARCDGKAYGEKVVLKLSKQVQINGPLQIEAKIDQDQTISKDLSLWNQQGSQVLRGQMLVLPVDNTFLYVEPIYIQSSQASMPQLKKVVVAIGNRIIYTDTYDEALAQLTGKSLPPENLATPAEPGAQKPEPGQPVQAKLTLAPTDPRLGRIREHLKRYRELSSQGRWADAGRELEAIEADLGPSK